MSQNQSPELFKITRVNAVILRIPTIRPHKLSMATMTEQRSVLLEIETADGLIGLGEAATINGLAYSEESPDSIRLTLEKYFAPLLVEADSRKPAKILSTLRKNIVGNYFAFMALETALLDIVGQRSGLSLSELLGGRNRDRVEVAWTLASGDTGEDIEEGQKVLDDRLHRHFKLKIGKRNWRDDVAHVAAISKVFRGKATIRVDLNQAWDFATAKLGLPALFDAGVELVEQPLPIADVEGARILRETCAAAIMLDESLRGGPVAAMNLAKSGAGDVFALKTAQAGGLMACRTVAEIAIANGIGIYGGTMLEGSIATLASAHLFSCLPEQRWGTELFGPLLLTKEILAQPLTYKEFGLELPNKPGLGIELDIKTVQSCLEQGEIISQ